MFTYIKKYNLQSFLFYILLVLTMSIYLVLAPYYPIKFICYVFWIIWSTLSFFFIWQIINMQSKTILYIELIITILLLHSVFILPVHNGAFGRDIHYDITATYEIAKEGWPIINGSEYIKNVSDWPLLHFLGYITSEISGLNLFSVTNEITIIKILPTIVNSLSVFIFFELIQLIFKDLRVSFISSLCSFSLYYNVMFHSLYVRETIGYTFYLLIIYLIIKQLICGRDIRNSVLLIILLISLAFSHHLTFLFTILFLTCMFGVFSIMKFLKINHFLDYHKNLYILGISMVIFVSYLIFIGGNVLEILVNSIISLFVSEISPFSNAIHERLLKDSLILVIRFLFTTLFSTFILYNVYSSYRTRDYCTKGNSKTWEILFFTITILFFIIIILLNSARFPVSFGYYRIESFIWPFFIAAACNSLLKITKKKTFYFIFSLFILFNLFQIPTYIYDPINGTSGNDELMVYTFSEYEAVNWIGSGRVIGDIVVDELAGGLKMNEVVTDMSFYEGNFNNIKSFDWIYLRENNFNKVIGRGQKYATNLSQNIFFKIQSNPHLYKVYDNKNSYIYRIEGYK